MECRPPYKTAEELAILDWERDGLIALIGPLSRQQIRLDMSSATAPDDGDNYSHIYDRTYNCGTCHCIGGWIAFHRGMKDRDAIGGYVNNHIYSEPLKPLFYPPMVTMFCATAPQAAQAIINFLTLDDPSKCWDFMSEPAT